MVSEKNLAQRIREHGSTPPNLDAACARAQLKRKLFSEDAHVTVGGICFRIFDRLGAGGMGAVYEVERSDHPARLAMKVLHEHGSEHVFRLKREFRTLSRVAHPNLVELYSLFVDEHSCAFTMQRLRGRDFLAHLDPPRLDVERLRDALLQLSCGVEALHREGIIHRDLKPSNVLVDDRERVTLLDFGIALDEAVEPDIGGTPAFMPDEQRRGCPVPASDLYAIGTMLQVALQGTNECREDLEPWRELSARLRADDPNQRPTASELRALLEGRKNRPRRPAPTHGTSVVAHPETMHVLSAELSRAPTQPRLLLVEGPSGVGKSMLAKQVLHQERARSPGTIVLSGRCSPIEAVPFRALDPLIDALSTVWKSLPPEEGRALSCQGVRALAQLFPVLARVAAVDELQEPEIADPRERRRIAIAALRTILSTLAGSRPVLLALDDVQWLDEDSLGLLTEVVRMPFAAPLTVIGFARTGTHPAVDGLRAAFEQEQTLTLGAVEDDVCLQLAASLLPDRPELWQQAARSCEGNPFVLSQLSEVARDPALELDALASSSMFEGRLSGLDELPRRLLEVVSLSRIPMPWRLLERALEVDRFSIARAVQSLERRRLLRVSDVGYETSEPYHDRVGEAVQQSVVGPIKVERHRAIARALEAEHADEHPAMLVFHLREAGKPKRASTYAKMAAEQAEQRLAFREAAGFYAQCVVLDPQRNDHDGLVAARAHALARGGCDRKAAEVLAALAARTNDPALRRRRELEATEHLFRAGHTSDALDAMTPLLRELGERPPKSTRGSVSRFVFERARLALRPRNRLQRNQSDFDPRALDRIDACLAIAMGAGSAHVMLGLHYGSRALWLASKCGEPSRLARALFCEAVLRSLERDDGPSKRALADAASLIADLDDPRLEAHLAFATAQCAFIRLEFGRTRREAERALTLLHERCTGVSTDLAAVRYTWFLSRLGTGDTRLDAEIAESLRDASERGDFHTEVSHRVGLAGMLLLRGKPQECTRELEAIMSKRRADGFDSTRWAAVATEAQVKLYQGRAREGHSMLRRSLEQLRRYGLLRVPFVRVNTRYLIALSGCADPAARPTVARIIEQLRREPFAMAKSLADQLGTVLQNASPRAKAARLREIAQTFDRLESYWPAQATRALAFQLEGRADALGRLENDLRARGVSEPLRYLAFHAPLKVEARS